jgi:polyisoprenoid-binding protein YceI
LTLVAVLSLMIPAQLGCDCGVAVIVRTAVAPRKLHEKGTANMRLRSLAGITAIVGGLAAAPAAYAASELFSVNKPHTIVAFSVDRLGLTKMLGSFSKVDGEFSLDRDNPAASTVSLTIETASIYTGFEARDKHLRSPDFFNVQEFPQMKFVSTKIERTGDKTAKVTGDLTLLGVAKPVTLDVVLNGIKQDAKTQKDLAGFSAKGTLKRSDFGMKYLMGAIGDEVTLMLEVLGDQK